MERKVIQFELVSTGSVKNIFDVLCLCNDGTMWIHHVGSEGHSWTQLENIPQPVTHEEHLAKKNAE